MYSVPSSADPYSRLWRDHDTIFAGLFIAGLYLVFCVLISPLREFPLNDDWAYAQAVRHLLDTGHVRLSEWTATTLIFQVYWGGLFGWLSGDFSFSALRVSTLVISALGAVAFYLLLRQLSIPPADSLLGVTTLVTSPLYLYLSYTFMSDIFFVSLLMMSQLGYSKGLRIGSCHSILLGSLFASLAFLNRQLGVFVPVAAVFVLAKQDRHVALKEYLAAAALPALAIAGYVYWLYWIHGVPWAMRVPASQGTISMLLRPDVMRIIVARGLISLPYLGLSALPVLTGQVFYWLRRPPISIGWRGAFEIGALVIITMLCALGMLRAGGDFPYLGNVINRGGVGNISLPGQKVQVTPEWVFYLSTPVSILAGGVIGWLAIRAAWHWRREVARPGQGFVLFSSVMLAIPTAAFSSFYDRYLLVLVPVSIFLSLRMRMLSSTGRIAGLLVIVAVATYSLVELNDHLAWNEARWTVGRALVVSGTRPEEVDGGFEWIGWHEFEQISQSVDSQSPELDPGNWMTRSPRRYWLAFSPLPGKTVLSIMPYGNSGRAIYVLTQQSAVPDNP